MGLTVVLTDRAGTPLGELREASDRNLRLPLLRIPTFTGTIDVDNPLAAAIAQDDKTLLKVYEDWSSPGVKTLRHIGPIASHQKARDAGSGTIAFTSAGAGWRLSSRLIGKNVAGATFGTDPGTPGTWLDRGEMAGRIVDAVNAGNATNIFSDAGDTGIRRGVITASANSSAGPWRYKPAAEALSELSAPLDGFDWEIAPVEPTADSIGVQIGALNCSAAIGGLKVNAGWEFGSGRRNVQGWTDLGDASSLCNRGISLPPSYPDNGTQLPIELSDVDSIADRGLYEAVIPGDLLVDDLRTKLVQENLRIRRVPRRAIGITPIPEDTPRDGQPRRVPRAFIDFIPGDIMPFRATETIKTVDPTTGRVTGYQDIKTVDALFRCFALQLAVDDKDTVTSSLTLLQDG